jgi:hypothetical protein
MSLFVSDELFNLLVRDFWPDMACQAYDSFAAKGRGVLVIHKIRDAINLEDMKFEFDYTAYDDIAVETDANIARLVREYAPDDEFVVQYQRSENDIHTLLVKTPPGESPPKLICLFRGISMMDIFDEFGYGLTYTPEIVYARARKKGKK